MPLKGIHVDDKLQIMKELVEIMEREIKRLKRSRIPLVKVHWNSRRGPEFTWEREDSFKQKYPQLFTDRASSSPTNSLNAAAGGNLLTKTPRDALTIIENKSKVRNSQNKPVVSKVSTNAPSSSTPHFPEIAALADAVKAMLLQKSSPPSSVKAVEEICVTCGCPHPYHQCLATDGNAFPDYRDNIQGYFQQPQ
ncbi:hypothetical protein Tco_0037803 [Tanacetum coccineum]